jgi:hypothetical protein
MREFGCSDFDGTERWNVTLAHVSAGGIEACSVQSRTVGSCTPAKARFGGVVRRVLIYQAAGLGPTDTECTSDLYLYFLYALRIS